MDGLLKIEDSVEAVKIATVDLEPYVGQITNFSRTVYRGGEIVFIDEYWCESLAAWESIRKFKSEENLLNLKIMLSSLFDTFVLGGIAGYCHAKFNMTTSTVICGIIAAA